MEEKEIEDVEIGNILRPTSLKEYIGQEHMKTKLNIMLGSAKQRKSPLDHILFSGPPGLGKTTISSLIAKEMNVNIISQAAPSIEKSGDLVSVLLNINENDIVFLDEIHRLPVHVEETLYSAMEDYKVDIITSIENGKEPITLTLPKFTLIGATTRPGLLSAPLRDRFGSHEQLQYYTTEELAIIVKAASYKIGFNNISDMTCNVIGQRSRGTPRIALKILKRLYDYSLHKNDPLTTEESIQEALEVMTGMDKNGLNDSDRNYLRLVNEYGPIGLKNLSSMLSEDPQNIEDYIEPYFMKNELILKTSRGRKITDKGISVINDIKA